MSKEDIKLNLQKIECEDAILCLMKDGRGNDYFFVRGILERIIEKIDSRLQPTNQEPTA